MTLRVNPRSVLAAKLSASLVLLSIAPLAIAADNPYGYVSGGSSSAMAAAPVTSTSYGSTAPVTSYSYPSTASTSTGSYGTGSAYGTATSAYSAPAASTYASPYASTTSPSYPSTSSSYSSYGSTDYGASNPYNTTSSYGAASSSYGTAYGSGPDLLRGGISMIPQGTVIMTRLNAPVNSASAQTGDPVSGTVEADIYNGTQLVIPSGSTIIGSVSTVEKAGRVGKHGAMGINFNVIRRPDGTTIPFQGHIVTESDDGVLKGGTKQSRIISTAVPAVGGAAAGTVLGAATGGLLGVTGTGAGTGLAMGTIAGVSYALIRKGKQVALPTGSRLSVMVDQPVAVN